MAAETALVYGLGLSLVGAGTAWANTALTIRRAKERGARLDARLWAAVQVLFMLPATLPVLGIALWFLSQTDVDVRLAEAAMLTYGVSAALAGSGEAVVFARGIPAMLRNSSELPRIIVYAALPEFAAIHGLTIGFLLLRVAQTPADVASFLAVGAWTVILLSVLAAAVAAGSGAFATSSEDAWTATGFTRGVLRGATALGLSYVVFFAAYLLL